MIRGRSNNPGRHETISILFAAAKEQQKHYNVLPDKKEVDLSSPLANLLIPCSPGFYLQLVLWQKFYQKIAHNHTFYYLI